MVWTSVRRFSLLTKRTSIIDLVVVPASADEPNKKTVGTLHQGRKAKSRRSWWPSLLHSLILKFASHLLAIPNYTSPILPYPLLTSPILTLSYFSQPLVVLYYGAVVLTLLLTLTFAPPCYVPLYVGMLRFGLSPSHFPLRNSRITPPYPHFPSHTLAILYCARLHYALLSALLLLLLSSLASLLHVLAVP